MKVSGAAEGQFRSVTQCLNPTESPHIEAHTRGRTMKIPKIFEHFHQGQIFTIEEAKQKLNSHGNTLRKRLSELASRGYIRPLRQGLYQMCVITTGDPIFPFEPFAIAAKLTPFGAISFGTALYHHCGSAINMPTIYLQSPSKFNSFQLEGVHFVWCHSNEATGLLTLEKELVGQLYPFLLTTVERTLIDCLKKPLFAPNPNHMVALSRSLPYSPNLMKMLRYAFMGAEPPPFFNRLGFYLESLQNHWAVPQDVLDGLKAKANPRCTPWYHTRGRPSEIHFTPTIQKDLADSVWENPCLSQKWNLTFEGGLHQGT